MARLIYDFWRSLGGMYSHFSHALSLEINCSRVKETILSNGPLAMG
ncbi:hypothetical protein PSHT_05595 [Puccinia striiformis]|uniref:Uncharacterized protein n=2 Tax=Puccinia striiformis TaxID=27350 RepID=A0A2S4WA49_9BASI|nr:hypothetical protein PSHT_05595 [Puccinia striiformis]